jgi:hypothetical protein
MMRMEKSQSAYLKAKTVRFPEGLDGLGAQTCTEIVHEPAPHVKNVARPAVRHLTHTRIVCKLQVQ